MATTAAGAGATSGAPGAVSANKAELLAIADAVAREKLIDKAIVIEAMEDAIQRAARARYGAENDIRAKLDPVTGDLRLWRVVEVVEEVDDHFKQVDLKGAQKLKADGLSYDLISSHYWDAGVIGQAIAAGATLVKRPQTVFWGGYSGYFADLDGHLWEIAHNPFSPNGDDGTMQLPE